MVRSALLFLLALAAGACQHRDPGESAPPPESPSAAVSLLVHNRHWLDVNVYVMHGNVKKRLGTVNSASDRQFTIPWSYLGGQLGLQLSGDPVGQRGEIVTDMTAVRPGSHVEWTIEGGLRSSSVVVY